MSASAPELIVFAASGVEWRSKALRLARRRLGELGYEVVLDASVRARHQRFAGDDAARLSALYRVADAAPSVAMASRGGYGFTRLLDAIDWTRIAASIGRGTRWVGHSDVTAFQLALLSHAGAISWHGPMAAEDFGRDDAAGGVDEVTRDSFAEAMRGVLEAVGWRGESGFDGLGVRGRLWGGNLTMLVSLLGTPHWPRVRGGVLFVEDVNEHPYRIERALLQLHQAGVLGQQKAVVLGQFTDWRASPLDRGYTLKSAIAHLRTVCRTPILTGLPFGHVPTKVTLPIGARVELTVQGREVLLRWAD